MFDSKLKLLHFNKNQILIVKNTINQKKEQPHEEPMSNFCHFIRPSIPI